jgi:GNAT superfamily N-acetyltransferase
MRDSAIFTIRAGTVDELPVAAQLRFESSMEHGADYDRRQPGWRERFIAYFRAKQEAGLAQMFLAYDRSEPVGMLFASFSDTYRLATFDERQGRINALFVRPQWRRRGIARVLMNAAMGWLKERGCTKLRLNSSEMALPLYFSMGFRRTNELELEL